MVIFLVIYLIITLVIGLCFGAIAIWLGSLVGMTSETATLVLFWIGFMLAAFLSAQVLYDGTKY